MKLVILCFEGVKSFFLWFEGKRLLYDLKILLTEEVEVYFGNDNEKYLMRAGGW